jgi:osmotically-inducible protein OsmY
MIGGDRPGCTGAQWALAWTVLFVVVLAGCGGDPPSKPPRRQEPRSPAEILSEVRRKLSTDSRLQGAQVLVEWKHDVLYLRGAVVNEAQKELAEELATATAGVPQTINLLIVGGRPRLSTSSPAAAGSDSDILKALQAEWQQEMLRRHSDLSFAVKQRKVSITGWVRTKADRDAAARFAHSVPGVTAVDAGGVYVDQELEQKIRDKVHGDLVKHLYVRVDLGRAVIAGEAVTNGIREQADQLKERIRGLRELKNRINEDAAVQSAVERAIRSSAALQEFRSRYSGHVRDGIVTLEGWIDDPHGRELMEQAIRRVPGVRGVINKMEVRSAP